MDNQKVVFVAGATGVIGMRLCKMLIKDNWMVVGTTRDTKKTKLLEDIGVKAVVVDVYDAKKLDDILMSVKPDVVMHQLTDLPAGLDPDKMEAALVSNAKLREIGTKNLIHAATKAGVKKIIAQSIGFVYEPGPVPHTEESALLNFNDPIYGTTSRAVASLEDQVMNASFIGIVLRNGLLYGPGTGFDTPVDFVPAVHVDACAHAAFLALKCQTNAIYNVADDDKRLSTQKVKAELQWNPNYRMED
ncbi:MAG TPA: NAD(P)-dependent oxidoreductase [Sulfuricurvum sp.]|nr:MAG: dTDP-glucose 4,6-dehydratase [Campylobacterales bacterium 16-40-21]OZA04158.1 MAG: dTDP-glucose 4,6-dehydratase [Sulfuricurvum sp. 17-40-25]HQS66167.1 NAD(P)-dependent oxidoreductase [Sulfuricurvum sp.]HQT35531.1 NAD(P)-dependent oxidoreductase [Sulfuricurvum sp.]